MDTIWRGRTRQAQRGARRNSTTATNEERLVEAGDVLFVAVNIIRRYGVDAEQALKASNAKFERRFRQMEDLGF